jgi:hypothetical protein
MNDSPVLRTQLRTVTLILRDIDVETAIEAAERIAGSAIRWHEGRSYPAIDGKVDQVFEMVTYDGGVDEFLSDVRAELIRARAKFPGDRIMGLALAEEFGELAKAMLDESAARVRKEAVQTAVMAARVALDGDGSVREWREHRGLDAIPLPTTQHAGD